MTAQQGGAGVISRVLDQFPVRPVVSDEQMRENVRSAVARGLPRIQQCKRHDRIMSIAAGGPSLADTVGGLTGVIVTANAGLGYLLDNDVTPWACGILDPGEHIADMIEPRRDVFFFVASVVNPRVFDKLADCTVVLWHGSGLPGISEMLPAGTDLIGGGSTMGLRWLNLGYFMGFRHFECHGLDSSYRGVQTHAYPDRRDGTPSGLVVDGYPTSINFVRQVQDFLEMRQTFAACDDPPTIRLHGDGLLQATARC